MNMTIPQISFKGYDACPIKNVYIDRSKFSPFYREMRNISSLENFELVDVPDVTKWSQDNKTVVNKNGIKFLIHGENICLDTKNFFKKHGITPCLSHYFATGGNCFIGKNSNKDSWLLVGWDSCKRKDNKPEIAKAYGIDEKNVYVLPQQDFHLDMFLRPVGYPYVLVNDPALVIENLKKLDDGSDEVRNLIDYHENYSKQKPKDCDETVRYLERYGFKPIRIAGEYSGGINFMNAIVNIHDDGTMSYITNSSETNSSDLYCRIQEMFEQDLRERLPNIGKIYFIKGKYDLNCIDNVMIGTLRYQKGGIHCMVQEEPNFDTWV